MIGVTIPLLAATLAAACSGDNGSTSTWDVAVPNDVVDAVRNAPPGAREEEIAFLYGKAKDQVSDATDQDMARWLVEALAYWAQVEEQNACLDEGADGGPCDEVDEETTSSDDPLG